MIKNGIDDGTGVFPMHGKRDDQLYVILYYGSGSNDASNVFGGIFADWKDALWRLEEFGYDDVRQDDDDQILVNHHDPEMHVYARIKKFTVGSACLAGGIVDGKMIDFVPYFY